MTENIHTAILEVMSQVGYVQKQRTPGLNYSYAGEAALIEAIRPAMIEAGITMHVSNIQHASSNEYTTKNGSVMHSLAIICQVTFTHGASQTSVTTFSFGEGADSGDKGAYKAQTGAYKYALRQTFCIETGDDPDKTPSTEQDKNTMAMIVGAKTWDKKAIDAILKAYPKLQHTDHVKAMLDQEGADITPAGSNETIFNWAKHYMVHRELSDDRTHCISEANKMIKENK